MSLSITLFETNLYMVSKKIATNEKVLLKAGNCCCVRPGQPMLKIEK